MDEIPWRRWGEDLDSRVEAAMLVKSLEAPSREVLSFLVARPGRPSTFEGIARHLGATAATVDAASATIADRINQISEICDAFRREELLDVGGGAVAVPTGIRAEIIRSALESLGG